MNTLYMNFKKPYVSNTPLESFPWLLPALFYFFFCFFSVLLTARAFSLEALHWRARFCFFDFLSSTLFEKHFKLKTISSENQLKKRKDNALNRAMKWIRYKWTIKTTRQQYSTSSRFRGFARPCFFFLFVHFGLFSSRLRIARWSILFTLVCSLYLLV